MTISETLGRRNVWAAMRRGLGGRCPQCGRGHLFRAYLKHVDQCAECGEQLKHIRADDGPAWLTILIVGHIVVALAFEAEMHSALPTWVNMSVFGLLGIALCLWLLPRAKGFFIGTIWATKSF